MVDRVAVIDLPRCEGAASTGPSTDLAGFVAGPENRLAVATLERVLSADASVEDAPWLNPLVFTGPSGVGKSHLARGIARYWGQLVGPEAVGYFTAVDFARQLHAARGDGQMEFFRALLSSLRLLVVEDIDKLPQRPFVQRELRDTIDALVENNRLVVLTAGDNLQLEPGLRDRLVAGLGVRLCPPGLAARQEILRQAAKARSLTLSDDEVQQLAHRVESCASQLTRALAELDLQQTVGRGLAFARPAGLELRQIIAVVARYYSLTQASLLSSARRKSLVHARAMVVYLARLLTPLSYAQIGDGLGRRDHSTIMHAHQCIHRLAATDVATQRDLDQLRRILTAV